MLVRAPSVVWLSLLLPLWAACARRSEATAPVPVPAVLPVAPLPLAELPALQRARVEYALAAAERVQARWPFMTPRQTCLLLIEAEAQWVLQCARAPAGFTPSGAQLAGQPVYRHAGGSFESGGQARSAAELLAQTPAAAHVPSQGAARGGLPGETPWLVLGSLEALAAFHPAFPEATTEAWVSVAMHELIHTHQLRAPGFAPVLAAIQSGARDPGALTRLFGRDLHYRGLVEREYELLVRAAEQDRRSARQALATWLGLYARRAAYLAKLEHGGELAADDALFSYLEGVARFVESDFLAQASLHPEPPPRDDPRFHGYAQFLGRGYAGSPNRQLDEQYFYAIGYHLCVLLERLDPSWKARVHTRPRYLFDLVKELAGRAE